VNFLDSDFPELCKRFLHNAVVQAFPFDLGQLVLDQDKLLVDLSYFSDVIVTSIFAFEEAIDERLKGKNRVMILVVLQLAQVAKNSPSLAPRAQTYQVKRFFTMFKTLQMHNYINIMIHKTI
jgi:hypothetical protein